MSALDEIGKKPVSDMSDLEYAVWRLQSSMSSEIVDATAERAAEELHALQERVKELEKYVERVSRLENIIQAARSGEYDNAHDITAIRKFLAVSMTEYFEFLKGAA